jgi:hypothetical protein
LKGIVSASWALQKDRFTDQFFRASSDPNVSLSVDSSANELLFRLIEQHFSCPVEKGVVIDEHPIGSSER